MSKVIELRTKSRSISRINKMMKAMQVVAVAQLKKAQSAQLSATNYKKHYDRLVKRLGATVDPPSVKVAKTMRVYVFSSERGFCGMFNEGIINKTGDMLATLANAGRVVELVVVGGKGAEIFRERAVPGVVKIVSSRGGLRLDALTELADEAHDLYVGGAAEKVYVLFNQFRSMLVQFPTLVQVLPFDLSGVEASAEQLIVEPGLEVVKAAVLMNYIRSIFCDAFFQTSLGEVASRLITMRSATESSKDMLDALQIKLNKARQATITIELSEILSAFEMLSESED
jgi:F-type H+-transporting ATPase subunit gamma